MTGTESLISTPYQRDKEFANPCLRIKSKPHVFGQPSLLSPPPLNTQLAPPPSRACLLHSWRRRAFSSLQAFVLAVSFDWNSQPLTLSVVGSFLPFRSRFQCYPHPSKVVSFTHSIPALYSLPSQRSHQLVDLSVGLLFAASSPEYPFHSGRGLACIAHCSMWACIRL